MIIDLQSAAVSLPCTTRTTRCNDAPMRFPVRPDTRATASDIAARRLVSKPGKNILEMLD